MHWSGHKAHSQEPEGNTHLLTWIKCCSESIWISQVWQLKVCIIHSHIASPVYWCELCCIRQFYMRIFWSIWPTLDHLEWFMKQDDLLPLFFNFAGGYVNSKVRENQWLELNRIHCLLVHVDVHVLGKNINIRNWNVEALLVCTKEITFELIVGNSKYVLITCHWNAGR